MLEGWAPESIRPSVRLADEAYRRLRAAIVTGLLPAGSRLSVPEVARRLRVSRSPGREAILRLADDGLVDIVPHKGAVVVSLTPEDLRGLYQLREVLDGLASRLAAEELTPAELARLERIMDAHRKAVADDDMEGHRRSDLEFHAAIREASRNPRLVAALDQYQGQIQIALARTSAVPGRARLALRDHERIFGAIRERDPEAAERATREHIARLGRLLADEGLPGGVGDAGEDEVGEDSGGRATWRR